MASLSEAMLVQLLRERYAKPEYALFHGVRNATGYGADREADALAMGLWPSRGLHLHGFECKSSRNDWIRELRDPAKADKIAQFCDFWWIVVGEEKVASEDELPHGWGLLVPAEKKGKTKLKAVREATLRKPKAITREFFAAVIRRAHEGSPAGSNAARRRRQGSEGAVGLCHPDRADHCSTRARRPDAGA